MRLRINQAIDTIVFETYSLYLDGQPFSDLLHESIIMALEKATREGFDLGLNKGWAYEQDRLRQQNGEE